MVEKAATHTWIDYTRRNDPVWPAGLERFDCKIQELALSGKPLPNVIMFWTKSPFGLAKMYEKSITSLREQGVVILAQVTINPGYQPLLEPAIKPEFWRLDELATLLGQVADAIQGRLESTNAPNVVWTGPAPVKTQMRDLRLPRRSRHCRPPWAAWHWCWRCAARGVTLPPVHSWASRLLQESCWFQSRGLGSNS